MKEILKEYPNKLLMKLPLDVISRRTLVRVFSKELLDKFLKQLLEEFPIVLMNSDRTPKEIHDLELELELPIKFLDQSSHREDPTGTSG